LINAAKGGMRSTECCAYFEEGPNTMRGSEDFGTMVPCGNLGMCGSTFLGDKEEKIPGWQPQKGKRRSVHGGWVCAGRGIGNWRTRGSSFRERGNKDVSRFLKPDRNEWLGTREKTIPTQEQGDSKKKPGPTKVWGDSVRKFT